MPEVYKQGSKVRLKQEMYNWPKGSVGTVALYEEEFDHGAEIKFDNQHPNPQNRYKETWFVTWEALELMTNNNMKFKVGDKVRIIDNNGAARQEIAPIGTETFINEVKGQEGSSLTERGMWDYAVQGNGVGWCAVLESNLELVSQGKLIGYELLKDTPNVTKGSMYTKHGNGYITKNSKYSSEAYFVADAVENNSEWFKPIYEAIKPTEVVVKTYAGDVSVNKYNLAIKGEVAVLVKDAEKVFAAIKLVLTRTSGYQVSVDTFKVGCKTFKFEDIAKLEAAIKQVS